MDKKREINKIQEITNVKEFEHIIINHKYVLVDFYTQWCGPCKKISPYVEELNKKYNNVKFIKIDIEVNKDIENLSNKLKIESIPTFILFKNGEQKNMITGSSKERLDNLLKNL